MSKGSSSNIILENVFYMLAYAFRAINLSVFKKVRSEAFDRPDELLGRILHNALKPHLQSGLYKTYTLNQEDIATVRGHILFPGTIRMRLRKKGRVSCEYDEFAIDNLFNQILKAALSVLLRSGQISKELHKNLSTDLAFLAGVTNIPISSIPWSKLQYQRNNIAYLVLMNFARLIIDGELMGDKDGAGNIKLRLFSEETLHDIYEAFLREYFRIHHPELNVLGKKQLRWDVPEDDQEKMPKMETDVMLRQGNRVLIIDAKYYGRILGGRYGGKSYNNGNLYQMRSYVESAVADPLYSGCWVAGLILYAKTDEKVDALRTSIGGNPIGISVLDLNQKFDVIAKQLDEIAKEYFP